MENEFDKAWEKSQNMPNTCASCYYVVRHNNRLFCQNDSDASWIPGIRKKCWKDRETTIFANKNWQFKLFPNFNKVFRGKIYENVDGLSELKEEV